MNHIEVRLNGEPTRIAPMTLAEFVTSLDQEPTALATVVNGRFVPRDARPACVLAQGDEVMTFKPIVGG